MAIKQLVVAGSLEADKLELMKAIRRSMSQIGLPAVRLNKPRQLNKFDKAHKSELFKLYHLVSKADDKAVLKEHRAKYDALKKERARPR